MVSLPNLNPKNDRTDSDPDWETIYPPTRRAIPPTNNKTPITRVLTYAFLIRAINTYNH